MGDKLPQSTPVLVRRLKRVAANCLKASRAATTDADRISWNARANTCWQCVARLEELSLRATGDGPNEMAMSNQAPMGTATGIPNGQGNALGRTVAVGREYLGDGENVPTLRAADSDATNADRNQGRERMGAAPVERWALMLPRGVTEIQAVATESDRLLSDADCYQWVKWADVHPLLDELARLRGEAAVRVEGTSPDARLLPVYFGLVATLAEVLGPDTYKVEARHLPAWARARLSEVVKR